MTGAAIPKSLTNERPLALNGKAQPEAAFRDHPGQVVAAIGYGILIERSPWPFRRLQLGHVCRSLSQE